MRGRTALVLLALGAAACGDPESSDVGRGYTKAPLETPGLLVGGEDPSPMASMSDADLLGTEDPAGMPALERAGGEAGAAEGQEASLAPGVTREQFEQGQELFAGAGACQACHGPQGGGSQLAPDLTDDAWLHVSGPDVQELAEVIRTGVQQPVEHPAPMPPMGGASLTDDQVQALAGYVASMAQG